jgi:FtsH-binding integral membrane protein
MTIAIAAGALDWGFAAFHLLFWRLFGWPQSLRASGTVNAAITQTFNWLAIYLFATAGTAFLWFALSGATVPPLLAMAGAGFWASRLVLQFAQFPMRNARSTTLAVVFAATAALHGAAMY